MRWRSRLPVATGAAVGVSQVDSAGAEGGVDGAGVEAGADPREGLPGLVQLDGVIDLVIVETLAAHPDALAVQVLGHRGAVDRELVGQVVHRGSGPVLVHQCGDLERRELPGGRSAATCRA